jgi:DNA-binding CsgD family transcriptional regulator
LDLIGADAVPIYMKISEKVLHLRGLGMSSTSIAERLGINPCMAKKAARWGNIQQE